MATLATADVTVLPLPSTALLRRRFQTTRRTPYNSGSEKNHD